MRGVKGSREVVETALKHSGGGGEDRRVNEEMGKAKRGTRERKVIRSLEW